MNKIEKLLNKISKKDREALLFVIEEILNEKDISHLKPIKLKGLELYRIRKGNFRIIFHKENNDTVIDSVKLRDENTYK
ncbi:MAG: type II toxin-antitoxin system mRNA interferase toxin, RelE/StbE family [Candidatus Pacebacteria bacterium]|nr:type II toxin-antitoxin system mRNA interferase toxin, RelE/StbE family [Candidatus Paceibacterota bacterium]MBP9866792.1 type II toxin-antitoxin system mRNA interferase toxin, RelE/StbE family [Candidatus Paceibacterota bacterium]